MSMFFDTAYALMRILVIAPLAYVALVVMLRVSGKRTLSKMNMFDWVVTVALGSMLASIIMTKDNTLLEGILGMGSLIFLQFVITWFSVRSESVSEIVKGEPTLLYHEGQYLETQLKRARVTKSEVKAAVREKGMGSLNDVVSVVLETDGTFSVVTSLPEDRQVPVGMEAGSRHT